MTVTSEAGPLAAPVPPGAPAPESPPRRRRLHAGRWISGLSMAVYLGLWIGLSQDGFNVVSDFNLPAPTTVFESAQAISPSVLLNNMFVTFQRVAYGMVIGVALGISLGLLMAYSRVAFYLLDPIVEAWRPVPALAFAPFLLLWFGLGEVAKILLIVLGVSLIILVNTVEAARNVPRIYLNAARTLGAGRFTAFRTVVIPRIVPDLIGPVRVTLALSFTLVVAAEFLGSDAGLGFMLMNAKRSLDTGVIFLGMVLFGVLSAILDNFVRAGGRYLTRWSERDVSHNTGLR